MASTVRSSDVTNSSSPLTTNVSRGAACATSEDRVVERRAARSSSALDHSSDLADLERHTVERCAEHHHLPAVAKCVGHDLAEVSDVDSHAFDRPTGGGLVGDLGDRRADRELVHSASLEKMRGDRSP